VVEALKGPDEGAGPKEAYDKEAYDKEAHDKEAHDKEAHDDECPPEVRGGNDPEV